MHTFSETLDTPVGPLQFVAGSAVAESVKRHFKHDPGVEYFMERHKDRLFPFYDVGANVGLFSVMAAKIGPGAVLAFEPDEQNLALLKENLASSGAAVTLYPIAVGAEDGVIRMGTMTCGRSSKSSDNQVEIPARSLNSIVAETGEAPGFIKLDIEGGESAAMLGLEGPECASAILEIEFSWRDHGEHFEDWKRIRPPGRYRWDFLLSPSEKVSTAESVDLEGRKFHLASASDAAALEAIIDVLKISTAERGSRKWELCIVPL